MKKRKLKSSFIQIQRIYDISLALLIKDQETQRKRWKKLGSCVFRLHRVIGRRWTCKDGITIHLNENEKKN